MYSCVILSRDFVQNLIYSALINKCGLLFLRFNILKNAYFRPPFLCALNSQRSQQLISISVHQHLLDEPFVFGLTAPSARQAPGGQVCHDRQVVISPGSQTGDRGH